MLFADFLNCAMTQAGLTNYKLAKRLDISQTTVANWLDGTTEPRSKKRKDVLALFGVTEQDLEAGQFEIIYSEDAEQKEKPTLQTESERLKEPMVEEALRLLADMTPAEQKLALERLENILKSR